MATIDTLRALVAPIVEAVDAEIYDIEYTGGIFRLTIDRPGGIDLETVAEATRQVSRQLDLDDPIPAKFTLEVTSPGLERNLRTPEHWATAVGTTVRVKMKPMFAGERRVEGPVTAVSETSATIEVAAGTSDAVTIECPFDQIDRARTVFEWGPQPKPGQPKRSNANTTQSDPSTARMAAVNESENS